MKPSQKVTYSVIALSWIDDSTALPEHDYSGPPSRIMAPEAKKTGPFRFSSVLGGQITISNGKITARQFTPQSGYYGPLSAFGVPVQTFPPLPAVVKGDSESITLRLTVGARTHTPEIMTEAVSSNLSGGTRAIATLVEAMKIYYPPIWTTLEITLSAVGPVLGRIVCHSLFPSLCFYTPLGIAEPLPVSRSKPQIKIVGALPDIDFTTFAYNRTYNYDAVPNLGKWKEHGWGKLSQGEGPVGGNPWGYTREDCLKDAQTKGGRPTVPGIEETMKKTMDVFQKKGYVGI